MFSYFREPLLAACRPGALPHIQAGKMRVDVSFCVRRSAIAVRVSHLPALWVKSGRISTDFIELNLVISSPRLDRQQTGVVTGRDSEGLVPPAHDRSTAV